MGMGRKRRQQESLWIATQELPRTKDHVFYYWVNRILGEHQFDAFAKSLCEKFYAVRAASAAGSVLQDAIGRLLRGAGLGTWDRLALYRLLKTAELSGCRTRRRCSGPFDAIADPASD